MNDFNEMSVGMILDYIVRYDGISAGLQESEKETKEARQKDFNQF